MPYFYILGFINKLTIWFNVPNRRFSTFTNFRGFWLMGFLIYFFLVGFYTGVVHLFSAGLPLMSCFLITRAPFVQGAFPMSNFSLVPSMGLEPGQAQSQQLITKLKECIIGHLECHIL